MFQAKSLSLKRSQCITPVSHCMINWGCHVMYKFAIYQFLSFFHGATVPSGPGPSHYRGFTITLRHTTLGDTPLYEWSARRKDLPDNTDIHASGGIRTRNPKWVVADARLRPRGHWDGQLASMTKLNLLANQLNNATSKKHFVKVHYLFK